jgi:hypothetical protein
LTGIPRHLAREVANQVAQGLVGLHVLWYLRQGERPWPLAGDLALGVAQVKELAVGVLRQNSIHLRFQQLRLSFPSQYFRDQNLILA